jgi:phenolic acid decarboxylase
VHWGYLSNYWINIKQYLNLSIDSLLVKLLAGHGGVSGVAGMDWRLHMRAREGSTDLREIIGRHLMYIHANGWQVELYVKAAKSLDYRIHNGVFGGRWVTDQRVWIGRVGDGVFSLVWEEPTGATVSLVINLLWREIHGTLCLPRWLANEPRKGACHQNAHPGLIRMYRDAGPSYPKEVIDQFATITFIEDCGPDRTDVINCAPGALPAGYRDACTA